MVFTIKEIILPRHKHILNNENPKIIALKNSVIEGYFLKGEKLIVLGVTGTSLKVKNEKGFISRISYKDAVYARSIKQKIKCKICGSLNENIHEYSCAIVTFE